jgi:2-polyprenyl-6-methoxyphenol hydroxylase-like FAD-dependent oxidoreductase
MGHDPTLGLFTSRSLPSLLPPQSVARSVCPEAATGLPIHNGKTGELLMEMKAEKPCRVSRRKLRKLFAEGIEIQYGKEVVSVKETEGGKVVLGFKDGTDAEGDVVVGCDGAHSKVREGICGKEDAALTEVPLSMFNFTAKFEAEQAKYIRSWNPLFLTSIHPDTGIMFWLSSMSNPLYPYSLF